MIICLFKGHSWSQWYSLARGDKPYRYCSRCGATEERIGQVVVKKRNILNWLRSLTEPSFIDEAVREREKQWYYHIPRDELNDAIKCLANELSKKDFDSPRLWLCKECFGCRYQMFCESIIHSMQKAFEKYAQKETIKQGRV